MFLKNTICNFNDIKMTSSFMQYFAYGYYEKKSRKYSSKICFDKYLDKITKTLCLQRKIIKDKNKSAIVYYFNVISWQLIMITFYLMF